MASEIKHSKGNCRRDDDVCRANNPYFSSPRHFYTLWIRNYANHSPAPNNIWFISRHTHGGISRILDFLQLLLLCHGQNGQKK